MNCRQIANRLVAGVVVAVLAPATHAITIYVDVDNCPGPGSGAEEDPYCSIQTAIDNAADTDEIVVAPGTYFEAIDFLGKAITLRSSDGQDDTVIDGTGHFHVVQCLNGEGPDSVLDGFTITGGNANGASGSDNRGGGMYNDDSSPTVTNCTFSENTAGFLGGGMYSSGGASPTVINCTFSGNSASLEGGGMYNDGCSPPVTDCTFTGNSTSGEGGGMYNYGCSSTVTGCTFSGNSASGEGGGMSSWHSSPTIIDCTFSGNSANAGGAMLNASSSPTVTDCTFDGNTADSGGGMCNWLDSSPSVTTCTFSENESVWSGGGMYNDESTPTLTDSAFCGNSPDHVACADGSVDLQGQIEMSTFCPIPVCPGDTDGDGEVGVLDFLELLAHWGVCP